MSEIWDGINNISPKCDSSNDALNVTQFLLTRRDRAPTTSAQREPQPNVASLQPTCLAKQHSELVHDREKLIGDIGDIAAYQPGGKPPIGPSPLAIQGSQVMLPDYSMADYTVPHELTKEEIQGVVKEYVAAAKKALEAGCATYIPLLLSVSPCVPVCVCVCARAYACVCLHPRKCACTFANMRYRDSLQYWFEGSLPAASLYS